MNIPDNDLRIAILARMVERAPRQSLGRTQVMKLFFFLQELEGVPLGYDFRLFNYGPFDSEVLSDLSTACGQGTVTEKTVIYPRGYCYDISPTESGRNTSAKLEADNPELAGKIDLIVSEFGGLSAAELELRSTILFADREFSQDGAQIEKADLAERVRQVKPHFSSTTILDRIEKMTEKGWLTGIAT